MQAQQFVFGDLPKRIAVHRINMALRPIPYAGDRLFLVHAALDDRAYNLAQRR